MMNMEQGQKLMIELCKLKKRANETHKKKDKKAYQKHLSTCMIEFDYLVKMHANRYKSFSNYSDLLQDGREVMLKAMSTFDPKKGSWFSWAHHYISTRISRSANLHTAIRFPLKFAKETPPHKETFMPTQIEERFCPDQELEDEQIIATVHSSFALLNKEQKDVIGLAFGLGGNKPLSPNQISKKLHISRIDCSEILEQSLALMKETIKL